MNKWCPKCENEKHIEDFYKNKSFKDGHQSYCKECFKLYIKEPHRKIKENLGRMKSRRNPKRDEYLKRWQLNKKYGITPEELEGMKESQDYKCAICEKEDKDCHNGLHIDHNHSTNKIRGLLCRDCNVAIGFLNEDTKLLLKAIEYINSYKEKK